MIKKRISHADLMKAAFDASVPTATSRPAPLPFDWDRLKQATNRASNMTPPSGAITSADYSANLGVADSTARRELEEQVRLGAMKTGKFRGARGAWVTYWWWADAEKK